MALDFPSSPTNGQAFYPPEGPVWIYDSTVGVWKRNAGTASPFNMIVNPAMQISQQNNFASTTATTINAGYYMADQWISRWSVASATINAISWAGPITAKNGGRSIYLNTTGGQAVLDANDHALHEQYIEGNRVADLNWGTASAVSAVLSFDVATSVAGTFSVRLANSAADRSFVATYSSSVVGSTVTIPIPGDTTGTWLKDTGIGIRIDFVYAIGSTYHGVAGWQAGNKHGVAGQTNGVAAAGSFHIGNVGLYADPYKTGVAPEFQVPNYEDDLQDCLRYWYKAFRMDGVVNTTTAPIVWMSHYVPMRATPARTLVGNVRLHDISVVPNITSITNYNSNEFAHSLSATASGFTLGRPVRTLVDGQTANYIAVSARM